MTLLQTYDFLARTGFPGAILLMLYMSMQGRIRWGREFLQSEKDALALLDEVRRERDELRISRDEWMARSIRYMERAGEATQVGESMARVATRIAGRE